MKTSAFVPSNAVEGVAFINRWCRKCRRDLVSNGTKTQDEASDQDQCPILAASFVGEVYEWVIGTEGPKCTAFDAVERDHDHP